MSNDGNGDGELYDAVAKVPKKNLKSAVEKVDGLSEEDEAALDRGGRFALRGTMRRIGRWSLWLGFGIGAALAVIFVIAVGSLTYSYLVEIVAKGKSGDVLTAILTFFAGVATTLGVEFLWHLSTRRKPDK